MRSIWLTSVITIFFHCANKPPVRTGTVNTTDTYCEKIDALVAERYKGGGGNYRANKIIPLLERKSGIQAKCYKGQLGYIYLSDSLLKADVAKWRVYFNCRR